MARSRDDAVGVVPVWLDLREGVLQDTLGIVVERLAQLAVLNQQPKSLDVKPLLHRHLRSLLHHLLNPLITQLNHGADADGKLVLSADALKRRMLELLAEVSQRAGEVFLKLAAPLQRNNNLLALIARIDRGGLRGLRPRSRHVNLAPQVLDLLGKERLLGVGLRYNLRLLCLERCDLELGLGDLRVVLRRQRHRGSRGSQFRHLSAKLDHLLCQKLLLKLRLF
mmetsp:Transcript_8944/g.17359  ORF Transcript_8944/g.17359 Transcript_8944/m.17359 type:complete len:224 (+) Transcript_8944:58-729(+)